MAAAPDAAAEETLPVWEQLVGTERSLRWQAANGKVWPGDSPGHDDSWGIGWFDGTGAVSLLRQTGSAADSAYFVFGAETAGRGGAGSGPARVVIGHLRKASCGVVNSENAHPIRVDYTASADEDSLASVLRPYNTILVAHNGTVYAPLLETLRADLREGGRDEARSDSDTVVLAGWLGLRVGEDRESPDLFAALTVALRALFERAQEVAPDGDLTKCYSGVNLLIAHPGGLFALRQYSRRPEYYTLLSRPLTPETDGEGGSGGWLVASEPTDAAQGWEPMPQGILFSYPVRRGEAIRTARVAAVIAEDAPVVAAGRGIS